MPSEKRKEEEEGEERRRRGRREEGGGGEEEDTPTSPCSHTKQFLRKVPQEKGGDDEPAASRPEPGLERLWPTSERSGPLTESQDDEGPKPQDGHPWGGSVCGLSGSHSPHMLSRSIKM